jgi:hypothetical protein
VRRATQAKRRGHQQRADPRKPSGTIPVQTGFALGLEGASGIAGMLAGGTTPPAPEPEP